MTNLKGKSFLKLLDYSTEEIAGLLDLAAELKAKKKAGVPHRLCEGKNVALIFEKTSTRTRCSFEVAAADLGMHPVYLDPKSSQMGKKESVADTSFGWNDLPRPSIIMHRGRRKRCYHFRHIPPVCQGDSRHSAGRM